MKKTLFAALAVLPSSVYAHPMMGMGPGMCPVGYPCGPRGIGFLLTVLTAALGYWVLHHSAKDQGQARRAGQVVGWTFVVLGLGGLLAQSWVKLKSMCPKRGRCPLEAGMMGEEPGMPLPPGHPDLPEPPRPVKRR